MSIQLLTFKTPAGYNKAKPITECLCFFDFINIAIACRLKIEITSWLVSAYDFYSRVVKDR